MAGKAKILAGALEEAIAGDERGADESLKHRLMDVDRALKVDITAGELAGIYARTLPFGMLAARLYGGPLLKDFTRQNAVEFLPGTYASLIKLFRYLAGPDLDGRISGIVDELAAVFTATDLHALLDEFRKTGQGQDPVEQFYETFLNEYDPEHEDSRGARNRPEPVVAFIKEAVRDYSSS